MTELKKTTGTGKKVKREKHQTAFGQTWDRLRRMPVAMIGLGGLSLLIFMAIFAPLIAPYSPTEMDFSAMFAAPSAKHLFGCDNLGRDIFSRIVYGARYSLSLGFIVSLIHMAVGVFFGCMVGYAGGRVDNLVMRLCDIVSAIPGQLFAILISASLGAGYGYTVLAMALSGLPGGIRGTRSMALKERNMEYLEAAQAMNCSKFKILYKHMMPNIIAPQIIGTTMGIGGTIQGAAGLAYIGLGVRPPTPEWGAMLSDARTFLLTNPMLLFWPGIAIAFTILMVNMFGDGLRDALDPRLKD